MAVFQVVVLFIFILGLARLFGVRFVEAVPAAVTSKMKKEIVLITALRTVCVLLWQA